MTAIHRLQEEWSLEQRAAEQRMADMAAELDKTKIAHRALEQREKVIWWKVVYGILAIPLTLTCMNLESRCHSNTQAAHNTRSTL